ncbi:alpha/beta hydrolase [Methylocystis heyeri]|nr:alpha/beta hydrolase [Methylocystis heyeri]
MNKIAEGTEKADDAKTPDFRIYAREIGAEDVSFYFIESSAPQNVEERAAREGPAPRGFELRPTDESVAEIARKLLSDPDPGAETNLVVMVHGFNNSRDEALDFFGAALKAVEEDDEIMKSGRKIVCVGYRWPSEKMIASVIASSFEAMPLFVRGLLVFATVVLLAHIAGALFLLPNFLTAFALALIGVIVTLIALRAIVYFRDVYRATNYAVPDLVEIIRQIDAEATKLVDGEDEEKRARRKRVALSFIGHSMGGFVVTSAIRVLSDVFDPEVITTTLSGAPRVGGAATGRREAEPTVSGKIGNVFTLMRFVLASPDIPGETLLADRANFLSSSLHRFREAYLFSNEGDEVLRMISTAANYFSFPTKKRTFGYRLGNAEILSEEFGPLERGPLLDRLRVGDETLAWLAGQTRRRSRANMRRGFDPAEVAEAFTYFDCTDYVEGTPPKGLLTTALNCKAGDARARISYLQHIWLLFLWSPLAPPFLRVDVHGGYFRGALTQQLIYRLACLGYDEASRRLFDGSEMMERCKQQQIRVLLSKRMKRAREEMDTPEIGRELRRKLEKLELEKTALAQENARLQSIVLKLPTPSPAVELREGSVNIGGVEIPRRKD